VPQSVYEKHARLSGSERRALAADLVKRYKAGESIRKLAASCNRSYGSVHRALKDAGVKFRGRGGARTRRPKNTE